MFDTVPFPGLAGRRIESATRRYVYTPNETIEIELVFDDGKVLNLKASKVMFDQFTSEPIIRVTQR